MFEQTIHKINSFRENHKLNVINEYKNSLLSLNKNSIFMRRIIESKEKEKKSSKKVFKNNAAKENCNYVNIKTEDQLPYNNITKFSYYQNNNIKIENSISKEKADTKLTENVLNEYIKNSSIISSRNKKFKNQIKEKSSLPINDSYKTILSSINFKNESNRNKSGCETDRYVLNYNGKKIFATFSFNESSNKTISPKRNNDAELFRNYSKLKLKREEIYNRKIKKDSSAERKELWTIEKEKELKDQNLTILSKEKRYRAQYAKKVKKIPSGNKRIFETQNCIKKGNHISLKKKDINSFTLTQDDDDTLISMSKNTIESTNKSKNKNKSLSFSSINTSNNNNKKNSCSTERTVNEASINDKLKYNFYDQHFNDKILVNKNIDYERKELSNSKDLNGDKKHKWTDMPKLFESKKKFVEDDLKESMIVTDDKKLTIKIHCIHNLNQMFLLKRKKRKFKIQKVMNILLSKKKKFYLNYLWNSQLSNKIKFFKNYNSLSSIKEEEKSKSELTNGELQIDVQEKPNNINLKRDRLKLKNIILKENNNFH